MKKADYFELVDRELSLIKDTIQRKNNDYTGASDDAFANFKVTEALGLSDARTGLLIRMVDKIQRLKTFIAKGELQVKGESAQDAARDCIGYSLILLGMLASAEKGRDKQETGLTLKKGRIYLRRDGSRTGKLEEESKECRAAGNGDFHDPNFYPSGVTYFKDGKCACSSPNLDLVEEIK